MALRAVLFDLGGVVLDSPLHAIAAFERDHGIPEGFVNRLIVAAGPEGAWGRLERGRIGLAEFLPAFEAECAAAGRALSARALMERVGAGSGPRPLMLEAIARIRAQGLLAAALTNNWDHRDASDPNAPPDPLDPDELGLRTHFDAFFESRVLGLQKPDPRIYRHACAELGVEPSEAVFLDDIGRNLKSARELGMTTIKVETPEAALDELGALLGFALRG